jgi:hypothetical protein
VGGATVQGGGLNVKRFPVGSEVIVHGCHAAEDDRFHVCSAACVDTDAVAVVVRHGRDAGGIYTRVRFDDGREENWHCSSLQKAEIIYVYPDMDRARAILVHCVKRLEKMKPKMSKIGMRNSELLDEAIQQLKSKIGKVKP